LIFNGIFIIEIGENKIASKVQSNIKKEAFTMNTNKDKIQSSKQDQSTSQSKLSASKNEFGTLTATSDANNDYSSSTQTQTSNKTQQSKKELGTLTAKADANNDYE
jgi:hypothetical protein